MITNDANIDSIGDGWDDAEKAVELWNEHIAPILDAATDFDNDEPPTISIGNGIAAYAADWAWEEFCGRGAGDDEDRCIELASELREKLTRENG